MKVAETAGQINRLTTDNDERQELWVHYLESRDLSSLANHLAKIRDRWTEEQLLQITVWKQLENPSDLNLQFLFDNFTDLEQSVIRLLVLGANIQQISSIRSIGVARLRHIITVIRENECWKELE